MRAKLSLIIVAVIVCGSWTNGVLADPCGMVPPIYPSGQPIPLARIGDQQTYVFFRDGIETFVIRPGFTGKVDEFGMLIPFPTPPAIRKVPDQIFSHVAAAIDPPEVVVDLRNLFDPDDESGERTGDSADDNRGRRLQFDTVRVLRQEAVGMYEVAVLEAGSATALKRWIAEYKMPSRRNDSQNYDAKLKAPATPKQGILKFGRLDTPVGQHGNRQQIVNDSRFGDGYVPVFGLIVFVIVGALGLIRHRRAI